MQMRLPLPAGELMRNNLHLVRPQARPAEQFGDPLTAVRGQWQDRAR